MEVSFNISLVGEHIFQAFAQLVMYSLEPIPKIGQQSALLLLYCPKKHSKSIVEWKIALL